MKLKVALSEIESLKRLVITYRNEAIRAGVVVNNCGQNVTYLFKFN